MIDFSNSQINIATDGIRVHPVGHYDLKKTLECGQCFRWERVEGGRYDCEYVGIAHGKVISVAQDGEDVVIYNATPDEVECIWDHYFALSEDYDAIDEDILSHCNNPTLAAALTEGRGIRILHQEAWETVCSFIISQNNNIPRIKQIISALSRSLGERVDCPNIVGGSYYTFPTARAILEAGEEHIFSLKTGFRAKYIIDAARCWCDGTVEPSRISKMESLDDAIAYLCRIKGVGLKVASCALLFGFERYDPFPVDVWMKRVLEKYFEQGFDPRTLGRYAGVAQQYLFDYERSVGNE